MIAHGCVGAGCGFDPAWWAVGAVAAGTLLVALAFRRLLPAAIVTLLLAAGGIGLAWAGMSLRPHPSTGQTLLAAGAMALLVPAHARIVLGPFGRPRAQPPSAPPSGG